MKQKIKAALQQGHSNLGVSDEVFERVAAVAETFITDEAQIPGFVNSEATKTLLKSSQSEADRSRTFQREIDELKAQLKTQTPPPADPPAPPTSAPLSAEAIAEAFAKQMKDVVDPLKAELAQLRAEKTAEQSIATAKAAFFANDWANGYPELRDRAWAQTMRIYEKLGGKMTAEELQAEAMENFKPLAQTQGLDVEKPFEGKGGTSANPEALVAEMAEVLKASGRIK